MPHQRNRGQHKFQCDFCPTRNSWVRLISVNGVSRQMCGECIAELAKQCRKEKEIKDAEPKTRLHQQPIPSDADSPGGIEDKPVQTETLENAS